MRIVDDLICDPASLIPGGGELNLSDEGISVLEADWGESDVDVATTKTATGVVVTDRNAKEREPVLSLEVRRGENVDLPTVAAKVQTKLGEWQRRPGWLERQFVFGEGAKFAGSLACRVHKASIDGLSNWKLGSPDPVVLRLLTDGVWYATVEIPSGKFSASNASHLIFELASILGTTPGQIRIRIKNEGSKDWRGLILSGETEDHPQDATKDTTAALWYPAEGLTLRGGAKDIGNGVVEHDSLTAGWLTILSSALRPVVRGVGAVTSGTGTVSPALPSGVETGDLLLMFAESGGAGTGEAATTALTAGGWSSPPSPYAAQQQGNSRATVLYRIATSSNATTTNDTGDHQLARIIAIKKGTFDPAAPFNVAAVGKQASTKAVSIPGATTTRDGCLILAFATGHLPDAATTAEFGAATNASLDDVQERIDNTVTAGDGGAIYVASGHKRVAGAYSATTLTAVTEAERGVISLAINPPAARHMTHSGVRRPWIRTEDLGSAPGDVEYKLRWRANGSFAWEENKVVPSPVVDAYQLLDMGEARPQPAVIGDPRWEWELQARAPGGSGKVRVKDVYPLPVEQYVLVRTPYVAPTADSQQTKTPGTVESKEGIGTTNWAGESNAKTSDNAWATVKLSANTGSRWLMATNFGFGLPEGATVLGIMPWVERSAIWKSGNPSGYAIDFSVRIIQGGVIAGSPHQVELWPRDTDAISTYGGASELWGLPWTPGLINAGFGFAISAFAVQAEFECRVDQMGATVFYTTAMDENRVCFASRAIELGTAGVYRQHPTDDTWGRLVPEAGSQYPIALPSGFAKRASRFIAIPSEGDLGAIADSGVVSLGAEAPTRPGYQFAREAL